MAWDLSKAPGRLEQLLSMGHRGPRSTRRIVLSAAFNPHLGEATFSLPEVTWSDLVLEIPKHAKAGHIQGGQRGILFRLSHLSANFIMILRAMSESQGPMYQFSAAAVGAPIAFSLNISHASSFPLDQGCGLRVDIRIVVEYLARRGV